MSGNEAPKTSRDEDHRLKNWSSWVKEWHDVQERIAKSVNANPTELVMNYSEGIYQMNAEKTILNYAEIPTEFDRYRGKPDFWKLPTALTRRKQCGCGTECICWCKLQPDYFAIKTKAEQFIIPSIETVGFPDYVLQEKNILNGARNIYKRWQSSAYRQKRMDELAEKIKGVIPHWPQFSELIVIGKKPGITEVEAAESMDNVETTEQQEEDPKSTALLKSRPRLCLIFNGIYLDPNTCLEGTRSVRVFFIHDISESETSVHFLRLENPGLATLRILWNKVKKFRFFHTCASENQEVGFYFDKKELVILPGLFLEFPIWFRCTHSGSFSESWEVETLPKFWPDNFHVVLNLQSYAYFGDLKDNVDFIVKYMEIEARNVLIRDILNDLIRDLKYPEAPESPCVYSEAQLFEMANLHDERPLFLFNELFVEELKQLYDKIKIKDEDWDYRIGVLQKLAHSKDVALYLDIKLEELQEKIRRIERELLDESLKKAKSTSKDKKGKKKKGKSKSKKSKSSKSSKSSKKSSKSSKKSSKSSKKSKGKGKKQKKKKGKSQLSETLDVKPEIKREPFVYSNQTDLWNIVRKFDAPVVLNTEREKYMTCFNVVAGYFGKMSQLLDSLKQENEIETYAAYPPIKHKLVPINQYPERLVYEYFEPNYIPSNLSPEIYHYEAKRKPKILRDISCDDIETLYSIYFNKPLVSADQKKKGKGKKKNKKSKSPKSKKSGKSPKNSKKSGKSSKKSKKSGKSSKKSKKSKKRKGKSAEKLQLKKDVSVVSFNPYAEDFVYFSETEEVVAAPDELKHITLQGSNLDYYGYNQYLIVYSCLGETVNACIDAIHSFQCSVSYPILQEIKPHFDVNK